MGFISTPLLQDGVVSFTVEILGRPIYEGHASSKYADGVLNLNLGAYNDPPTPLTEETQKGVDEHILGVIMINQYTLKKGLELAGGKAEEATLKGLEKKIRTLIPTHPF